MQISVLIEPLAGNGYQARTGDPFGFVVEGETRDEALRKVHELIQAKLNAVGTELVQLDVSASSNPWLRVAGTLDPSDPLVQEWMLIMAENRRKADEDPDYP